MDHKTDKELAVEAAVEFLKVWNSSKKTAPMQGNDFRDLIEGILHVLQNKTES